MAKTNTNTHLQTPEELKELQERHEKVGKIDEVTRKTLEALFKDSKSFDDLRTSMEEAYKNSPELKKHTLKKAGETLSLINNLIPLLTAISKITKATPKASLPTLAISFVVPKVLDTVIKTLSKDENFTKAGIIKNANWNKISATITKIPAIITKVNEVKNNLETTVKELHKNTNKKRGYEELDTDKQLDVDLENSKLISVTDKVEKAEATYSTLQKRWRGESLTDKLEDVYDLDEEGRQTLEAYIKAREEYTKLYESADISPETIRSTIHKVRSSMIKWHNVRSQYAKDAETFVTDENKALKSLHDEQDKDTQNTEKELQDLKTSKTELAKLRKEMKKSVYKDRKDKTKHTIATDQLAKIEGEMKRAEELEANLKTLKTEIHHKSKLAGADKAGPGVRGAVSAYTKSFGTTDFTSLQFLKRDRSQLLSDSTKRLIQHPILTIQKNLHFTKNNLLYFGDVKKNAIKACLLTLPGAALTATGVGAPLGAAMIIAGGIDFITSKKSREGHLAESIQKRNQVGLELLEQMESSLYDERRGLKDKVIHKASFGYLKKTKEEELIKAQGHVNKIKTEIESKYEESFGEKDKEIREKDIAKTGEASKEILASLGMLETKFIDFPKARELAQDLSETRQELNSPKTTPDKRKDLITEEKKQIDAIKALAVGGVAREHAELNAVISPLREDRDNAKEAQKRLEQHEKASLKELDTIKAKLAKHIELENNHLSKDDKLKIDLGSFDLQGTNDKEKYASIRDQMNVLKYNVSASKLDDTLKDMGSDITTGSSVDMNAFLASSPSKQLDTVLEAYADIVATMKDKEIKPSLNQLITIKAAILKGAVKKDTTTDIWVVNGKSIKAHIKGGVLSVA